MSVKNLLKQYAIESGEMPEEVGAGHGSEELNGVLLDEIGGRDQSVVETLDMADDAQDIAMQLDELADRATEVDQSGASEKVLEASTEAMYREFSAIMRARKLVFKASSFEAAEGKDRLKGLIKDARQVARISKAARDSLRDYSSESSIWNILTNDKGRLAAANKALVSLSHALSERKSTLQENPQQVKHEGFKRFLTREGKSVTHLKEAIHAESEYLIKAHKAIVSGIAEVLAAAKELDPASPALGLKRLESVKLFGQAMQLETPAGYLMGNYAIKADHDSKTAFPGLAIPKYSRTSTGRPWEVAAGVIGGVMGAATGVSSLYAIGGTAGIAYGVGAMLGAGKVLLGTAAAIVGVMPSVSAVAAGYVANKAYTKHADKSEAVSVASASDLVTAVQTVIGYEHILTYNVDANVVGAMVDHLHSVAMAKNNLDPEQRKALEGIIVTLDHSMDNLMRLASELYEQAFYTTTQLAAALQSTVGKE